jgi:hypothetical protein
MSAHCVLAFAGHMIDRPDRATPRFPKRVEAQVRKHISHALQTLSPGMAVVSGACGGDLIFAEEALRLGIQLHVILPFADRDEFLAMSVSYAGPAWVERFDAVCERAAQPVLFVKSGGYTGDENFEANQRVLLFFGLGMARVLQMPVMGLVLCDRRQLGSERGGTRSFLEMCQDLQIPHYAIDLSELTGEH